MHQAGQGGDNLDSFRRVSADAGPTNGIAARVARLRRPRLMLAALVCGLYGPLVIGPFYLDDYRAVRLMGDYQRGDRPALRLYEFLADPQDAAEQRRAGTLPWWVADDMRFRYLRPVSDVVLYGQFKVFGRNPIGYRAFSLLLYVLCVWSVLGLCRAWLDDEVMARTAALVFAVASFNAVPATFIAAQCDLLALLFTVATMAAVTRFVRGGGAGCLLMALIAYAAALGAKEGAVAACVVPLGLLWIERDRRRLGTLTWPAENHVPRVLVGTAAMLAMALAYMGYYAASGYGSNGVLMLNPFSHPLDYLLRMPGRLLMLLSSWLIPVNPAITFMFNDRPLLPVLYTTVGTAAMVFVAWLLLRLDGRCGRIRAFAWWAVPFLPLLACTPPDNRVLMLPAVGLSVLGAALTLGRAPLRNATDADFGPIAGTSCAGAKPASVASEWPRRIAVLIFVLMPMGAGSFSAWSLKWIERQRAETFRSALASAEGGQTRATHVFFLNSAWVFDLLWCQDTCAALFGDDAPRVHYLTETAGVRPETLGPRTLRLHATDQPFLTTFLGRLAQTREAPPQGSTFDAGEFVATIRKRDARGVTVVDFEFAKPLNSPEYRFFLLDHTGPPMPWGAAPSDSSHGD
ncbi:MAG: glycosyltransferase family 39 protein [Phycisphaerae bacterium]|nr:hypothetical protein [Phycisphaerae bacterium]NUQ45882.1 glycosyltransferase family 39 protein [Phycisphaerae bacterium]